MRDILLLLVPLAIHWTILLRSRRFRTDHPSWPEIWTKSVHPDNYSPNGRKFIPWLYASALLFALGVAVVILTS